MVGVFVRDEGCEVVRVVDLEYCDGVFQGVCKEGAI